MRHLITHKKLQNNKLLNKIQYIITIQLKTKIDIRQKSPKISCLIKPNLHTTIWRLFDKQKH